MALFQRVLLIDDSVAIHNLLRARLSDEPVEVITATTGEEGLAAASRMSPDLILLDVELADPTGLDGFEICERIKLDPLLAQIPVIFLSGASTTAEKIRGLELGALDYITKPFDPAELRARVRGALRLKYLLDLLSRKAQIDGLTGLWNRAHFEDRLNAERSLARRRNLPLSCVMADVDRFKSFNDRFGHAFGDHVLRQVAWAMTEVVRTEDVICRYGGEEFAVIAPATNLNGAEKLAQRLRVAVSSVKLAHLGHDLTTTCSFGVCDLETAGEKDLIEQADAALYQAKHNGRDQVVSAPVEVPVKSHEPQSS